MDDTKAPTIADLEELLAHDYDIEIKPDGSISATNQRPRTVADILTFRSQLPATY